MVTRKRPTLIQYDEQGMPMHPGIIESVGTVVGSVGTIAGAVAHTAVEAMEPLSKTVVTLDNITHATAVISEVAVDKAYMYAREERINDLNRLKKLDADHSKGTEATTLLRKLRSEGPFGSSSETAADSPKESESLIIVGQK